MDGFQAKRIIDNWIGFYNCERPHTALDKPTPNIAYLDQAEIRKAAGPLQTIRSILGHELFLPDLRALNHGLKRRTAVTYCALMNSFYGLCYTNRLKGFIPSNVIVAWYDQLDTDE